MKRALVLAVPLAVSLGLVAGACGDDDDEPDVTTADVTVADDTESELSLPDLSDVSIPDLSDVSIPDLSDVSIPDLSDVSIPDLSDISIPEDAEDILGQIFPGLDEDQIGCLFENLGGSIDPSRAMELLDECNIDPSDLTGG